MQFRSPEATEPWCNRIPRLDGVFNLSGSEVVVILLLALVVLGPEKLPEAIRRVGRIYAELKKMSAGFQTEFRSALDEPLRELRQTAELTREAVRAATEESMLDGPDERRDPSQSKQTPPPQGPGVQ